MIPTCVAVYDVGEYQFRSHTVPDVGWRGRRALRPMCFAPCPVLPALARPDPRAGEEIGSDRWTGIASPAGCR